MKNKRPSGKRPGQGRPASGSPRPPSDRPGAGPGRSPAGRPDYGSGRSGPSRADRWGGEASIRTPDGLWYLSGHNGVVECLKSPHLKPDTIWVVRSRVTPELWAILEPHQRVIQELRGKDTPYGPATQGIAALVRPPEWPDLDDLLDQVTDQGRMPFVVALDQVEDPMNLGQILRSCEGAGVDAVLLLKHRSVHMNQTVAQVSQGAFAWLPVLEIGNLRNSLDGLKDRGLWVVGCESGIASKMWHQCDFRVPMVLVMGAEGKGLRELTRKTCDQLAELPMRGRIKSLNVGAATSAFLYEIVRQRSGS